MRLKTALLLTAAFLAPCSVALATPIPGPITSIVSFGDSLSDGGNAFIATSGAEPGAGYATKTVPGVPFPVGYFTNPQVGGGPSGLWVDQLAAKLGVTDPSPSLAGGTNYAVGSAMTGNANPQDMANQLGAFFLANPTGASSSALYTFWGGANDILADPTSAVTAADNIASEIEAVAGAGGQNFLWLNLPDLGGLPLLAGNPGAQAAANAASQAFNAEWASQVSALDALGINVIGVNIERLINDVNANPAAYGLTDVTSACALTSGCNPNTALYWDLEHPTTQGHALVANLAYAAVAPVPEPSTFVLVGTSVLALAGSLRRRIPQPPASA
ncbi:MAG TPA: SGNH/GDSL hydrolase family protein [Acidobacteriaceae bacterium]